MAKRFFIIGIILLLASSCFAATAGNTSDPKIPYGPGIANLEASGTGPLKFGFEVDGILDRDLEGKAGTSDAEIEGEWYLFRIGYTFAERVEPYVKIGGAHLKTSWKEGDIRLKVKGENSFAVGFGGKVLLYEMPEHRLRFSLDGQYLYTDPGIDAASASDISRSVSAKEFEVKEWQITGIISMEFPFNYNRRDPAAIYSLIPYVGFGYFNSDNTVTFTDSGTVYDLGETENADNFLFITGCDVTSPNNVSFNVEGRWVGETAGSGGFTVKF